MILIVAWVAVILFGLFMCRLAARSDDAHVAEVAEWLARRHVGAGQEPPSFDSSAEHLPFDVQRGRYGATG